MKKVKTTNLEITDSIQLSENLNKTIFNYDALTYKNDSITIEKVIKSEDYTKSDVEINIDGSSRYLTPTKVIDEPNTNASFKEIKTDLVVLGIPRTIEVVKQQLSNDEVFVLKNTKAKNQFDKQVHCPYPRGKIINYGMKSSKKYTSLKVGVDNE